MLPDAGRPQKEDARHANQERFSKHTPALPLFREEDAFRALTQLQPVGYDRPVPVAPNIEVEFINAGHLLGSAYARVPIGRAERRQILLGGDLGRYSRPILPDPMPVRGADALLVESTYGGRVHEQDDEGSRLASIVRATAERRGKLVIPSFAIGCVEEVLYWLDRAPLRGAVRWTSSRNCMLPGRISCARERAARRAPVSAALAGRFPGVRTSR